MPQSHSRFGPTHPGKRCLFLTAMSQLQKLLYGTEMLVPVKLKVPTTVPPLP